MNNSLYISSIHFQFRSAHRNSTQLNMLRHPTSSRECQMSALLDSIMAPATTVTATVVGVHKPPKRSSRRRRPPGWKPMPRAERVYKNCAKCGARNHVRRLFCKGCYVSKAEMGVGAGVRHVPDTALMSNATMNAQASLPNGTPNSGMVLQSSTVEDEILGGAIGAF